VLLKATFEQVKRRGWEIENIDCNIIAQAPRLKQYKSQMEARIAGLLEIETRRVNVKAKTNEGLDAVGRKEAIVTQAVVLLRHT
jgi:2-C-methyl-D-erythritol 2,4-cyclodiphosphate synthase